MIDLLFVALFQAAAGAPDATPPANPPAATEQTQTQQAQATGNTAPAPHQYLHCRVERTTGSQIGHRVCRTREQEQQEHDNVMEQLHDVARPDGTRGG